MPAMYKSLAHFSFTCSAGQRRAGGVACQGSQDRGTALSSRQRSDSRALPGRNRLEGLEQARTHAYTAYRPSTVELCAPEGKVDVRSVSCVSSDMARRGMESTNAPWAGETGGQRKRVSVSAGAGKHASIHVCSMAAHPRLAQSAQWGGWQGEQSAHMGRLCHPLPFPSPLDK